MVSVLIFGFVERRQESLRQKSVPATARGEVKDVDSHLLHTTETEDISASFMGH